LGQLVDLKYLYLEGAASLQDYHSGKFELFNGIIPTELMTLTSLVVLDLNFNNLSGTVSMAFNL